MAALTPIGYYSAGGSDAAPTTGTHGITINSGYTVVVWVCYDGVGNSCSSDDGLTEDIDGTLGIGSFALAMYSKVAGGSEPTHYDFTLTDGRTWGCIIGVYSGGHASTIWDVAPSFANEAYGSGTGTTITFSPITTGVNDAMVLAGAFFDSGAAADYYDTPTNGFTERAEHVYPGSRGMCWLDKSQATAGGVGATTLQQDWGDQAWTTMMMSLNPAAAAGSKVPVLDNAYFRGRAA